MCDYLHMFWLSINIEIIGGCVHGLTQPWEWLIILSHRKPNSGPEQRVAPRLARCVEAASGSCAHCNLFWQREVCCWHSLNATSPAFFSCKGGLLRVAVDNGHWSCPTLELLKNIQVTFFCSFFFFCFVLITSKEAHSNFFDW